MLLKTRSSFLRLWSSRTARLSTTTEIQDSHHDLLNGIVKEALKKIHPDLVASEEAHIRDTNLKCVQNLQQIRSTLLKLIPDIEKSRSSTSSISLSRTINVVAFQKYYDLDCYYYLKSPENEAEPNSDTMNIEKLSMIEFDLQVPTPLTVNQTLAMNTVTKAYNQLLARLLTFFYEIQLCESENYRIFHQYLSSILDQERDTQALGAIAHGGDISKLPLELRSKLYDQIITRQSKEAYQITTNTTNPNKSRWNRRGTNLVYKMNAKRLATEVEIYLKSGRVKFQYIQPDDEEIVYEKFSRFLMEYGDLINFSCTIWSKVIIVLVGKTVDMKQKKQTFTIEEHEGFHVLYIPINFKPHLLLDFIQHNLDHVVEMF